MLGGWLCFATVIAFYLAIYVVLRRHARRRLYEWAIAQGYDILGIVDPPLFQPGPFFLKHGRGWSVTRIVVRTGDGGERIGWVCYPAGLPWFEPPELRQVELVWDDEWDRSRGPFGPYS